MCRPLFLCVQIPCGGGLNRVFMGAAEGAIVGFEIQTLGCAALLVAAGGTDLPVGIDAVDGAGKGIGKGAVGGGAAHGIAAIPAGIGMDMLGTAIAAIGGFRSAVFCGFITTAAALSLVLIVHPILVVHFTGCLITSTAEDTGCRVSAIAIGSIAIGAGLCCFIMVAQCAGFSVCTIYICLVRIGAICAADSVVTIAAENIVHGVADVRIGKIAAFCFTIWADCAGFCVRIIAVRCTFIIMRCNSICNTIIALICLPVVTWHIVDCVFTQNGSSPF